MKCGHAFVYWYWSTAPSLIVSTVKKSHILLDFPVKIMIIYFVYIFVNLFQNIKTLFHKRSIIYCFEKYGNRYSVNSFRGFFWDQILWLTYGPRIFLFTFSVRGQWDIRLLEGNSLWFSHFHLGNTKILLLDMLFYQVF